MKKSLLITVILAIVLTANSQIIYTKYVYFGNDSIKCTRHKSDSLAKSIIEFEAFLDKTMEEINLGIPLRFNPDVIWNLRAYNIKKDIPNFNIAIYNEEKEFFKLYINDKDSVERMKARPKKILKPAVKKPQNLVKTAYGLVDYYYLDNFMNKSDAYPHTTQFTYFDINYVHTKVHLFVSNTLGLSQDDNIMYNFTEKNKSIIYRYQTFMGSGKPKELKIKYNVFPDEHNLIIKSVEISGFYNYVANFFIKFWYTSFDYSNINKNELLVNNFLQDRVALTSGENRKINITSSTIKSEVQFREILKKSPK